MITEDEKEIIINKLSLINPTAQVHAAVYGDVDVPALFLNVRKNPTSIMDQYQTGHLPSSTQSISFTFNKPIDWNAFGLWLSMLLHANGEKVLRVKGLLDVGEEGPVLLNGVQHIIHPPKHLDEWPETSKKRSEIVFIMKTIEPNEILGSLYAFQTLLGAKADVLESAQFLI
ncbi:GTP-binding protein [Aneurinibacillus terranovensis]|uniref:GTP-binding protein n=1 Tax=Aneurinibacillus terranovensis TaxID=278991 RepID=UPI0004127E57|nr:GTP-binding protein [Aneurinibacillus terranovensis]